MQIDVVSDTVCPWCFIGKRRLTRALAMRPELDVQVFWRPYRLDPTIPREGIDRRAYMKRKFGDRPNNVAMRDAIVAEGESEGITFAFDKIQKTPNTLDSHRLVRWAAGAGKQDDMVERLFRAYFNEGRDVGDAKVLSQLAGEAGMDAELVADLLYKDCDLAQVEREAGLANEAGITGVPTFIFDNRFLIAGAREADLLVRVIDKALEAPGVSVPVQ